MATEHTEQEARTIERRQFLVKAAGAAAVGVAGAGAIAYSAVNRVGTASSLVARYRSGPLPIDEPHKAVWTKRAPYVAKTILQNIATPAATAIAIPELRIRAMHNGEQIAFHLEWTDPNRSDIDAIARFRDAVAVQLAVDPATDPSITMGGASAPVHVLHWKASWQADIDSGRKTVKDAFPNMFNDVRPEDLMPPEQAKVFYPAWAVGNPLAQRERKSPVEELAAVGFGTLTSHKEQEAAGRGVYAGKRWRVVLAIPMQGTGTHKATIAAGEMRNIAFAVWSGSEKQRGPRKQYVNWLPIEIEAVA